MTITWYPMIAFAAILKRASELQLLFLYASGVKDGNIRDR